MMKNKLKRYAGPPLTKGDRLSIGAILTCVGVVVFLGSVFLADLLIRDSWEPFLFETNPEELPTRGLFVCGFIGLICLFTTRIGVKKVKEAIEMPTPEVLAALPAEEVLVRSSSEPTENAGKTLLRATVTDTDTPADELLRPTDKG